MTVSPFDMDPYHQLNMEPLQGVLFMSLQGLCTQTCYAACLRGRFINGSSPAVHLLGARCRRAITPNGPAVLDDLITALSAALSLDFGAIYTETDFF